MPIARRKRCSVCGALHNMDELRKTTQGALICTDCIREHADLYVECDDCHIVHIKYNHFDGSDDEVRADVTEVGNRTVCNVCLERRYVRCEGCGEYVLKRDALEIDNTIVCPTCSEDNFATCDACGRTVFAPTLQEINDGEARVCQACRTNVRACHDCGRLYGVGRMNVDINGNYVCEHCQDNYVECADCHRLVPRDQAITEEDGEEIEPVCRSCNQRGGASVIHSYHNGEEFVKRYAPNDSENEVLFFGLELEVAGSQNYAKKFLRLFEPQTIQLMHDSSVSGFEIITMPMTYNFMMQEFIPQLKRGLQFLIDKDFKGHNYGGLHIHVSEEAITKFQAAQLAMILYGNKNDRETWKRISQRRDDQLHWCALTGNRKFYDVTDDTNEKPCVSSSRHTALNHDASRTHTYEFRIFNSSLRLERILKNIECVVALLDYTKKYENAERPICNTTDFLKYVTERKIFYPNLCAFLEETHIVEQHYAKDFSLYNNLEVA